MSFRLALSIAAATLVALAVIGPFLDRVVFPESAPGPEYIPAVGQVFHSTSEGFTQRIVKHEGGLLWSELTMRPHAPGPPPHIHTAFAERFRVERGTVGIRLGDQVVQLKAGEEYLVKPGTLHQPFNPTGEEAVVFGSTTDYALPEQFGIFLSQAYGFFDSRPENGRMPRALLQMSRFSPQYDSWIGGPPIAVQRAMYWVVAPIARMYGYRTYYPQYAPTHVAAQN